MIYKVFSVYDSKANAYLQPIFSPNAGDVERAIRDHANDPKHNFYKYAEDFTLFMIGTFDVVKGEFVTLPAKVSLGNCLEFKKIVE